MMSKHKSTLTLFLVLGLLNSQSLYADELEGGIEVDTSQFKTQSNSGFSLGEEGIKVRDFSQGLRAPVSNGFNVNNLQLLENSQYKNNQISLAGPMSYTTQKPLINCVQEQETAPCFDPNSYTMFAKHQINAIDLMNSVTCNNQYQFYDFGGQVLSEKSCERELACATGGQSNLNLSCIPDKNDLDKKVNNVRYNDIVAQASLRNLVLEPEVEAIEMSSRIAKEVWNLEIPRTCNESLDQKVTGCGRFELDLMASSFESFSNTVINNYMKSDYPTQKERTIIENDKELDATGKKNADNVVGAIKRMRHLIYHDRVTSSSVVDEVKKFQADLLDKMKQSPKATATEIKIKMLSDYGDSTNSIISFFMNKNSSDFEEVIKTFDRQGGRSRLNDATAERNPLAVVLKKSIGDNLRNRCVNSNYYSMKMSCEVLQTALPPMGMMGNRAAQFRDVSHSGFFGRGSLKFLSEGERAVFLVKACENVERVGSCEYSYASFAANSRQARRCANEISTNNYNLNSLNFGVANDAAQETRGSGLVDTLSFDDKSESSVAKLEASEIPKTEEDSNWTGHIADAFSGANGVMGGSQFAQAGRNSITDLTPSKKNENTNEEVAISDSEKEKLRRAEDAQRIQNLNNNNSGFDSLRQELEALRTQMSIKQASDSLKQTGAQANSGQVVKDDAETEALKKKISDLEAKLTSAPAKKVDRDYEDSGAWLRSPAGSRSSGSVDSKAQAQSNGRNSQEGSNSSNGSSSASAPVPGANRNQSGTQASAGGSLGGAGGLSLVRYENQSMVVLPQNATTQDVEKKILELGGKPFFIENADGSFTQVITELDKDGKPALNNEGKPKFLIKKVASDKVTSVKSRGVAAAKPQAKVRDLKELDAATRKRELDELLKKTKK